MHTRPDCKKRTNYWHTICAIWKSKKIVNYNYKLFFLFKAQQECAVTFWHQAPHNFSIPSTIKRASWKNQQNLEDCTGKILQWKPGWLGQVSLEWLLYNISVFITFTKPLQSLSEKFFLLYILKNFIIVIQLLLYVDRFNKTSGYNNPNYIILSRCDTPHLSWLFVYCSTESHALCLSWVYCAQRVMCSCKE